MVALKCSSDEGGGGRSVAKGEGEWGGVVCMVLTLWRWGASLAKGVLRKTRTHALIMKAYYRAHTTCIIIHDSVHVHVYMHVQCQASYMWSYNMYCTTADWHIVTNLPHTKWWMGHCRLCCREGKIPSSAATSHQQKQQPIPKSINRREVFRGRRQIYTKQMHGWFKKSATG